MLNISDLAKYPFLPDAAEYVKNLKIEIKTLVENDTILFELLNERALQRINDTLDGKDKREVKDTNIEIISYPRAIMLLNYLADEITNRRFALFESKQAYNFLHKDTYENIEYLASIAFNWKIQLNMLNNKTFFKIHFFDYLKCASAIKETRYRLIKRYIKKGYVQLTKIETSRLLQEEIFKRILSRFSQHPQSIPDFEEKIIHKLEELIKVKSKKYTTVDYPPKIIAQAIPPCIKWLKKSLDAGKNLSHMGRFTFTSFLLNIGTNPKYIYACFKASADFDDEKSRYQVEHIEGLRGTKKKYISPKCDTLKTHGICHNPDNICKKIHHPLAYYRRRMK
jgi:DNA primase large subunit